MTMKLFGALALALGCTLAALPAAADSRATAEKLFSSRTVAERESALAELDAAADATAIYSAGAARFFMALEGLGQGLYRHGFESPRSFLLPLMRLPVPENPSPQPLTYEGFRAILADFHSDMKQAAETLSRVPADADIGVVVDLTAIGIDMDADGAIGPTETAAAVIAALSNPRRRPRRTPDLEPAPDPVPITFRFDRADGYWLQGYANVLMAQADFWLAHDFRTAFDASFHMVFPRAKLPLQDVLVPTTQQPDSTVSAEWRIADLISFIHYTNWPVVEPDRRRTARAELLEMVRLSRENWKSILAETDNDREWLPGPKQTGENALTGLVVGQEQVDAWHEVLTMSEDLLEGRKLLPHFRITGQGLDMRRFFEEPQTFDFVTLVTGPGAVPWLAEGDILTAEEFRRIRLQFGRAGFMTFALWFN